MVNWELLQIAPTTDIGLIKKAYAALVKTVRPDEKPAEFSALHSAYKNAIKYAKNAASQTAVACEEQIYSPEQEEQTSLSEQERAPLYKEEEQAFFVDESIDENAFHSLDNEKTFVETPLEAEVIKNQRDEAEGLDDILQQCDDILSEDNSHIQYQRWSEFCQKKTLLDKDIHFKVSLYLINAICALVNAIADGKPHKKYAIEGLGTESIQLLNHTFLWQEEKETLKAFVHPEALDAIVEFIDKETSDDNKSLAAVQGGVSAINRYSEEEIAIYETAVSSFFALKVLFIMWCLVLLVVFCVSLLTTLDGLIFRASNLQNFILVISQFLLCFKLCQNNKLAFNCVWPIAVLALLLVPFGTVWGIFTLGRLLKARHYYKFADNPPIKKD
ncbi:hypothetical protein [Litorilituus sediminis]|uniref:J domain-containing protein n=1 Tax=Litorilituus sediminis TaxID=718192 RepID=A0A4P6P6E0_9GAMM|nr:hypothetical protein [Litorilituus sediminis]QBG34935.1 hypothetical protein EMK97_03895 [Litorilituus sediminis]